MPVFIDTSTGKPFAAKTLLVVYDPFNPTWNGADQFSFPGGSGQDVIQFCEPVLTGGWNGSLSSRTIAFWTLSGIGVYHRNGLIGMSPDLPNVGAFKDANRPDGDPWYAGVIFFFGPGMSCLNQGDGTAKLTLGGGTRATKWINFSRSSNFSHPLPAYTEPTDSSAAVDTAWSAYQSAAWSWTVQQTSLANAGLTNWLGLSDPSPYDQTAGEHGVVEGAGFGNWFAGELSGVAGILADGVATVVQEPFGEGFRPGYCQACQLQGGFQAAAYPVSGAATVGAALGEPLLFARLLNRQMVSWNTANGPADASDQFLELLQTRYSTTSSTNLEVTSNLFDILWGFSNQTADDGLAQDILDQVRSSSANVFATIDAKRGSGWWTDVDCSSLLALAPPAGAQQFWLAITPSSASYGSGGGGLRNRVEWLSNPFPPGFNLWSNYPFVSNYYFHPQSALLPYWEVTLWA